MKHEVYTDMLYYRSPQHAGSNLVIAVDVCRRSYNHARISANSSQLPLPLQLSGNGKIDQSVFIPGSGAATRYDSLEIYLVSAQTGSNFTVSNGTGLLAQEPGSTVKHLNWPLPACMSPGVYNVSYSSSAAR